MKYQMIKQLATYLSLIAFTSLSSLSLAFTSSSTVMFEECRIADIDLQVEDLSTNTSFNPQVVLSKLKSKVGNIFSQADFDADLKTLVAEYDRVEPSIQVQDQQVYITLKMWPRPKVRSITWNGNKKIKTTALQKELGLKPNTVFNRQSFNKSFNKVKEYYVKKGYFESQLQYITVPHPKTNEVSINIEVHEGRSGRIEDIVFQGFSKEETSELLGMIYTKKYNLLSWLTGKGTYHEEGLEQDRLTIVNYLQNLGYADAKVDIQIHEAEIEGKILLIISTEKGPVFHFNAIQFEGNELFSNEEIEKLFLIHEGDVYSPEKLRKTLQAIKDLYGRKGYLEANVQAEAQPCVADTAFNISFHIDEGKQYRIGMIRIYGNMATQTHVILRESLLIPGETFDTAKLQATEARLQNVGYFESVNVYAVRTEDEEQFGENYRDIYIEVKETKTGHASLFVGFSSAESIFGGLDFSEANFNIKGFARLFSEGPAALRGGGEYAHLRLSFGKKQQAYTLSWLNPYFCDSLWRVGFDVFNTYSELTSKKYDIQKLGFDLHASYPLNNFWTFGLKYRFNNSRTHITQSATPLEREQANQQGIVSGFGPSLTFDSTDNPFKPHKGFRSRLETEFAGLGGDFYFWRFAYLNSYYIPLWKCGTFKSRFDFNFIEPVGRTSQPTQIPLGERFFIGGINSVRGYRDFDLGEHFSNGDPTGGISSTVLSLEYLHKILPFIDGFIFVDAGSIGLKRWYVKDFKFSAGFGARIEIANRVPITLGMGFPINPSGRSEVRRFFFSMGGQF
ncbi:outer membrane protein assembly factor BamA [Candidatus Rhabdochlamydia sp. T3358]|uniref:outer membrane protein assembly factor BamA n=1 Tax=Candidatus Rhabdochlamydia sp. T3358 TaxID=2099795 RepID=UPI0010FE6B2E|nr:outer membrane protein assembly factor BamA [Candidatus Rhabdochlamydia sp. T3358]